MLTDFPPRPFPWAAFAGLAGLVVTVGVRLYLVLLARAHSKKLN